MVEVVYRRTLVQSYWQMFCHMPFTCLYSQRVVPKGGNCIDGSGLSSIVGKGVNGGRFIPGKSKLLLQICRT